MKTQKYVAVLLAALLLAAGAVLFAQEREPTPPPAKENPPAPPPAKDDPNAELEWLEMSPGPGWGPGGPPEEMGPPSFLDRPRRDWERFRRWTLDKIKQEDPARFERLMKIKSLADEYRQNDDPARQKQIENELRPLVDLELKTQQEENKKRIERLEQRLAHWKKILKQREENWEQVVDYTIKDITGQNDYLKTWTGASRPQP